MHSMSGLYCFFTHTLSASVFCVQDRGRGEIRATERLIVGSPFVEKRMQSCRARCEMKPASQPRKLRFQARNRFARLPVDIRSDALDDDATQIQYDRMRSLQRSRRIWRRFRTAGCGRFGIGAAAIENEFLDFLEAWLRPSVLRSTQQCQ